MKHKSVGIGKARKNQIIQKALEERIKELTCLYGILHLATKSGIRLDEIMKGIVELLPPAWQYPEITSSCIVLDNLSYSTQEFSKACSSQHADIVVNNTLRGKVEVVYTREMPEADEGPFLKEERHLINAVAREIAFIVERWQFEEDRLKLREQLRHADRLATIGQFAAGVAHELNEPLNNILGLAQLSQNSPGLTQTLAEDIEEIIKISIHAREIIKKLLFFARQVPSQKKLVDLNRIIKEGLYFLESRCNSGSISLKRKLSRDLPRFEADPSQLHQVLVNLVVNSIHAMPDGGELKLETSVVGDHIKLIVSDTGVGMSEDVLKQIFSPFFTTKTEREGTGLGLPVVHGIVTSHGGTVAVESRVGQGTRFEVLLPINGPPKDKQGDNDVFAKKEGNPSGC